MPGSEFLSQTLVVQHLFIPALAAHFGGEGRAGHRSPRGQGSCTLCGYCLSMPGRAGQGLGKPQDSAHDAVWVLFWKGWFLLPQRTKKQGRP